jgi:hypothetical protein
VREAIEDRCISGEDTMTGAPIAGSTLIGDADRTTDAIIA